MKSPAMIVGRLVRWRASRSVIARWPVVRGRRPAGSHGTAAVVVRERWGMGHHLRLVGAVQLGAGQRLVELTATICVDDLLQRDEVGVEAVELPVDQFKAPRVALVVLYVDGHDP